MFQVLQILISLAAIIAVFLSRTIAWCILGGGVALFAIIACALKSGDKPRAFTELSPRANELLQKWHHFYLKPFSGTACSASCSGLALTAVILVVIGCFYRFWIGIGLGVVFYIASSALSRFYNPAMFLTDSADQQAHSEVIAFLQEIRENPISK
jgi:hypothetical protein